MKPSDPLPYETSVFSSTEEYVDSLLNLVGSNDLLRTLCGGVHVLDFFTSDPSLYARVLPQEWRDFFAQHDIMDLLDLFIREDLGTVLPAGAWRSGSSPPASLVDYIQNVRNHLLNQTPKSSQCLRNRTQKKLSRKISVGMTVKKMHEVGLFASYVDDLASYISFDEETAITHLVDFGSGQSYLGRALAAEPYNRNIVAIESKPHNAERAKFYDVKASIREKEKVMRNKKAFRAGLIPPDGEQKEDLVAAPPTPPPELDGIETSNDNGGGMIQHISHRIHSGDLTDVISRIPSNHGNTNTNLMVISLHSCGNLIHHGLRSLVLNRSVKAVAMVGCCYNLLTERLGPATYKMPELRPTTLDHPSVEKEGDAGDPHGFPMSKRLCTYGDSDKGIRLNITSRMMAVQAPANWGEGDSDAFFTRHFYRALLQRIFLDRGVVGPPSAECVGESSPAGHSSGGTPIVIGSLRKSCYENFVAYVRGALAKLYLDPVLGDLMREKMDGIGDEEIWAYEENFRERKKDLSVVWSLMAFSAGAVEAAIVVDRWLWLKEQEEVREAWVEPVFEYRMSPRNLVVVGMKH